MWPVSVKAADLPERIGTDYPAPHDVPCRQRSRRRLADAFGLGQFGVNLLELPPGSWSSQRHWHEREDEFVYVLEGEVELVTDTGATTLTVGTVAGFRAGEPNGHHLVNRSGQVARVLEVGTRTNTDVAHYPDIGMQVRDDDTGGTYFTSDGRPLT
ncbi:cupin domain-containing protein [Reyranella sp. CPCC 100927]|uniref:cupin domain-containing protein n=1 Tax=Reyranella sp. CPCC 100927 TaxID=2599616 RepID=UPI0011B7B32B|nr:cupin domain-containing protein [Reyranella sp. CPCC 100927]TWT09936.1 cupin domain-containing protein [Reyranella sp. CPCC 100927]